MKKLSIVLLVGVSLLLLAFAGIAAPDQGCFKEKCDDRHGCPDDDVCPPEDTCPPEDECPVDDGCNLMLDFNIFDLELCIPETPCSPVVMDCVPEIFDSDL
jgi:hypothetical protein